MKYTKDFETYWMRANIDLGHLATWQYMRRKRAVFNAFKKGKQIATQKCYKGYHS